MPCFPRLTRSALASSCAALVALGGCARSGITSDDISANGVASSDQMTSTSDNAQNESSDQSALDAGALDNPFTDPEQAESDTPPTSELADIPTDACLQAPSCSLDTKLGELFLQGEGGTALSTSGSGHAWVMLEAQDEHDQFNFGSFVSYVGVEAALDAASAEAYELFVYVHTTPGSEKNDQDPLDLDPCLTANDETKAALASSCARWSGDGPVVDKRRNVVIEVRPRGGSCPDWNLTITGYNDDERTCDGLNDGN